MPHSKLVLVCFSIVALSLSCSSAPENSLDPKEPEPGDPVVESVGGDTSNGASLILGGTEFGTHDLNLSSGVGPTGWIETNDPNTPVTELNGAPGWDKGFSNNVPAFIDDSFARTGSKSINSSVDRGADNDWQKPVTYDAGEAGFDKMYATWWVYFNPTKIGEFVQWKRWYIGSVNHHAACSSVSSTSSLNLNPLNFNLYQTSFQCEVPTAPCWEEVVPEPFYEPLYDSPWQYRLHNRAQSETFDENHPQVGGWTRVEIFVDSSDLDEANGMYELYVTPEGEKHNHVDTLTNLKTHSSTCDRGGDPTLPWRYFGLHGYLDDNGGPHGDEEGEFYYDDLYVQFGTRARIELGNVAVYEECTQLEIQTPTSWSDTGIEFDVNHGSFESGESVYLFVINSAGKVSPGVEITLD